jgi:DinB superfamily
MISSMIGHPQRGEAAEYYHRYIDRIDNPDIIAELKRQLEQTTVVLNSISEEKSVYRYGPDRWSIRQMWGHVNDTERVFVLRALWFARGMESALPSFDQDVVVAGAHSDEIDWSRHVEEFRNVRLATISFFGNLPQEAWMRTGTASGFSFTVRALAYIAAGHVDHHLSVLRERYL